MNPGEFHLGQLRQAHRKAVLYDFKFAPGNQLFIDPQGNVLSDRPAACNDASGLEMNEVGDREPGHGDFDREQARQRLHLHPSFRQWIGGPIGDGSDGSGLDGGSHFSCTRLSLDFLPLQFLHLLFLHLDFLHLDQKFGEVDIFDSQLRHAFLQGFQQFVLELALAFELQ